MSKSNQNKAHLTAWVSQEGFTLQEGVIYNGRWPVSSGTIGRVTNRHPPYTSWQARKADRQNRSKWCALNNSCLGSNAKSELGFSMEAQRAGF